MNRKSPLILLFGLGLIVASALHAGESATDVLKEAKVTFKKADNLQGAWVTTEKLIKKAESALKKGDSKKALKLANKARTEANLSLTQAQDQLKNWSEPSYIERK